MNSVGFVLLSFSVLGMAVVGAALFALRLKLSEPVSYALLFGRWGLPVGGFVGFYLALPVGQVTAVLLDNLGRFFESGYKHLCVGIAVVLQNRRDCVQLGGDGFLRLLNLLL